MSFISDASVTLPETDASDVFTLFSTREKFLELIRLSPSTHTIEITDTDTVSLDTDLTYDATPATGSLGELCERLHFRLIEQVKYLGITIHVTVLGTQIISRALKLHLYESVANNGSVHIRKLRRFMDHQNGVKVEEHIDGQTSWIMKGYVGRECRKAHHLHVSRYGDLLGSKGI